MRERLIPFLPQQGVVKDASTYAMMDRYVDANRVRFVDGFPETIGGWERLTEDSFIGKCRSLHAWRSNAGNRYLAVGTHKKLYVWDEQALTDITPLRDSGTLGNNPFSMTNESALVTVADTSHGADEGDYVRFSGASAAGGITIDGEYLIVSVTDANSYVIEHSAEATSTTTGGGASVDYEYDLQGGLEFPGTGSGYGLGRYGTGTYGTPRISTTYQDARIWSLDNWGELLIASPLGGDIYEWDPNSPTDRAAVVTNAPTGNVGGMFITSERHIVAMGADGDPMKLAWSDINDRTDWTATAANDAGDFTIQGGNRIVGGARFRSGTSLLWTDTTVFTMSYLANADVFSIRKAGEAGLLGPRTMADYDGVMYWMGPFGIHAFDGVLRHITPSEVDDAVFSAINSNTQGVIHAGTNSQFGEVWWWYPTSGREVSSYVLLDVADSMIWSVGEMERTAWVDRGIFTYPIAAGSDGILYKHETGVNADGSALDWSITSGFMDGGDNAFVKLDGVIPDFHRFGVSCELTVLTKEFPLEEHTDDFGPYTLYGDSGRIDIRGGAKLMAFKLSSGKIGSFMKLGKMRFAVKAGGSRR